MNTETISFRINKKQLVAQGHFFFDSIWKNNLLTRDEAYDYLCENMRIRKDLCHFRYFKRSEIIEAIKICTQFLNQARTLHDLPYYKLII